MTNLSRRSVVAGGVGLGGAALLGLRPEFARAADFPTKPFTAIVDAAPGGGHDRFTRAITPEWTRITGQPIIPEFKPGAGGVLSATTIVNAPADGYTLGVIAVSSMNVSIALGKPQGFGFGSFAYLGTMWNGPIAVFTGKDSKWESMTQVVEAAKTQKITAAVAALRAMYHISGVIFDKRMGIETQFVPYNGGGPSRQAAMSGETDIVWTGLYDASANYDGLRCLCVFDKENPIPDVIDAPTVYEMFPEQALTLLHPTAYCVSAKVRDENPEVYQYLVDAYRETYTSEATQKALIDLQFQPASLKYTSPEELSAIEADFIEQLKSIEI
ncbi:tripartite tricarboxylate transporter substrate binding protein [Acuticoccus kandeliae]|uniref:tripartite tricarboxylate transporter substrate binding protein n=1 Tax=Acuticoccus kandeliae TaxID=2073160 RepID=UPI000D3E4C69|nr:tripartite tricarboxylate transporter substrate binding protein [Acuticoccus kandeliae]